MLEVRSENGKVSIQSSIKVESAEDAKALFYDVQTAMIGLFGYARQTFSPETANSLEVHMMEVIHRFRSGEKLEDLSVKE